MMEGTTCQVFPLSVDRAMPLSLGSAANVAQTEVPLITNEWATFPTRPLVPFQVAPLSVDLNTFKYGVHELFAAANTLGPETMMSLIEARSMPAFAGTQLNPLSVDLYTPCISVPA
jgi:hypothetical protein